MRKMTKEEIDQAIKHGKWATICSVTPEKNPYAIEATYFLNEENIGFMINPKGTTAANVSINPRVLVKITFTNKNLSRWAGISCFGTGSFIKNKEEILQGWKKLGDIMQTDYSRVAKMFCINPGRSPFFSVQVDRMTGRCSAKPGKSFDFKMVTQVHSSKVYPPLAAP